MIWVKCEPCEKTSKGAERASWMVRICTPERIAARTCQTRFKHGLSSGTALPWQGPQFERPLGHLEGKRHAVDACTIHIALVWQ
jgi:hypothetical protein